MGSPIEIWCKGKPYAKYIERVPGKREILVGVYFNPDDHPREVFPTIEVAQKKLDLRQKWLRRSTRSLEATAAATVATTAVGVTKGIRKSSMREAALSMVSGAFTASVIEVGSEWCRQRGLSVERKLDKVNELANAVPPEPQPQS
jgi:hypothetical protein